MYFGVFYTCYTEKKSVDHSLEVLYGIYPEVPVYLISDGGSDYSDLEEKYTAQGFNLKTHLEYDSRGHVPTFAHCDDFYTEETQKKIFDTVMEFLERTKRAIEYSKKEYLLVMEPDVLVRGKISNPNNYKLLGSRVNMGMSQELRDVVRNYPGAIDVNTWGITPAIFECEAFLRSYEVIKNDPDLLRKLCRSDRRFSNYDFMFAVIFALIGIPESINEEIVECFRNHNWENTWHPLVHQYRAKYPLSTEGYDGTHVVNKNGMGDQWEWSR